MKVLQVYKILVGITIFPFISLGFSKVFIVASLTNFQKDKVIYKNATLTTSNGEKLKCDYLIVYFTENQDNIKKAIAKGHVIYTDKLRKITANEAIYNPPKDLILQGNVVVITHKVISKGDILIYNLKTKSAELKSAKPDGFVTTILNTP